jgi:hypothetical protein
MQCVNIDEWILVRFRLVGKPRGLGNVYIHNSARGSEQNGNILVGIVNPKT